MIERVYMQRFHPALRWVHNVTLAPASRRVVSCCVVTSLCERFCVCFSIDERPSERRRWIRLILFQRPQRRCALRPTNQDTANTCLFG